MGSPFFMVNCKVYLTYFAKYTILSLTTRGKRKEGPALKTQIAQLRRANKLSQEELAAAVGVTRQTITSIEGGKYVASLPLAHRIAAYFGLTIEEVFLFEED